MSMNALRLRDGVVCQVIDGEMLLLDARGGQYYDLNPTGTLMLQSLLGGASRAQTLTSVLQRCDVTSARAQADLDALIQALSAAGLITLDQAPPA